MPSERVTYTPETIRVSIEGTDSVPNGPDILTRVVARRRSERSWAADQQLLFRIIACNLDSRLRPLTAPLGIQSRSLTSLRSSRPER